MHASDATLVALEDKVQGLKVEKVRKGKIRPSVDGTDQSGPRLVGKMREPARAGEKARHMRAEAGHDIEL